MSKKYKKVDPAKFMRLMGGKKMMMRQRQDAAELADAKSDPEKWRKIINFGLPEITDMEGPAEC